MRPFAFTGRLPRLRRNLLALVAGLCVCFAMPPWGWWPLAIVGIALWCALLVGVPRRGRWWVGVCVGLSWFLPSTLWMMKFSPFGWPFGVAVWFPAIMGLVSMLSPKRTPGLALVGAVTLSEWFRWHAPFGGVPLSSLSMTQARGPLLLTARWFGTLGVTMLVAALGVVLAYLWRSPQRAKGWAALLGIVVCAISASVAPHGHSTRTISAAAVQGGGAQGTIGAYTDYQLVLQRHLDAARHGIEQPVDLVVMPENIVNIRGSFEGSVEQQKFTQLAKDLDAVVLAGIVDDEGSESKFFNYSAAIGPDGIVQDRYDKHRRVPFGEYVPMRSLIAPLAPDQLPKRDGNVGVHVAVLETSVGRIGCAISWETFFPRRIRESIHHDAEILTNPTNGASYWLSQVQTQQIASSTLRAVESGRWMIQAAPTGMSAIIDPNGNVVARSGIGESVALQATVEMREGLTLAMVWGEVPVILGSILCCFLAWRANGRAQREIGEHSPR